ncbi:hypothetical protein VVMO6_02188 [Vibrio vulnificus MO6-24/O]|nr:hypothetical protein VVMO6_02188 [Vibrio vulnificus MO6-24/O]
MIIFNALEHYFGALNIIAKLLHDKNINLARLANITNWIT